MSLYFTLNLYSYVINLQEENISVLNNNLDFMLKLQLNFSSLERIFFDVQTRKLVNKQITTK